MADVKVPGIGNVPKGGAIAGVAVLAVILGVAYYRHSRNKAAAPAAAAAAQPDPNAIDPATGLTYGEEAAGIQSGTLAGYGTPYGDTSGIVGYDAQGSPVYADQVGYGPSPSFVSNGNWSQAAEQYLVSTTGADAGTVAAALGTYLAGQPLTDAQAQIVQSAIAFFGQPPQAGSNGYPPSLRLSGTSGTAGTGTTGTGGSGDSGTGATGTPPPPAPDNTPAPAPAPDNTPAPPPSHPGNPVPAQVSGLHVTRVSRTSIGLAWNRSANATKYQVRVTYQGQVVQTPTTGGTSYTVSGLTPDHTYGLHVVAENGSQWAPETSISQKTNR